MIWLPSMQYCHHHSIMQVSDAVLLSIHAQPWRYRKFLFGVHIGQRLFRSLWLPSHHDQQHFWESWRFQILPFAPVMNFHNNRISEASKLLDLARSAYIDYWGHIQAVVHDDLWCPRKHWNGLDSQIIGSVSRASWKQHQRQSMSVISKPLPGENYNRFFVHYWICLACMFNSIQALVQQAKASIES